MKEGDIVRNVAIRFKSEGAGQVQSDLKGLANAQDQVAASSSKLATVTESSARRQVSAAAAFDRMERSLIATARAQHEFERVQRTVNLAVSQNPALQERAGAVMQAAAERYAKAQSAGAGANDNFSRSVGLARHELINLSRQAQDVAVSLAGGQSPLTVLFQQGAQIGDVFATSQGTAAGFFKQIASSLGSFLTGGRLAFGGVASAVTIAGIALNSYLDSQLKVQLALSGIGRASGATTFGINAAASAGASPFGLSVSEARDLGTALAATGKIANDNILPIIKMGHDFATTFGVDAPEATKMLARAFADPVKGAADLNDRLGFLDAAMQRQIASLVGQNRVYEAQKVLLEAVQGSLASTSQVTSVWSQVWNAVKNTASDAFGAIGKGLSDFLRQSDDLPARASKLKETIAELEKVQSIWGSSATLVTLKKDLAELNELMEKQAKTTRDVAAAQASLRQQQSIMGQLPEVAQRQALADQATVAGAVAEDPVAQRALGITQAQANRVRAILNQIKSDYRTTFEDIQAQSKIALDAVTAFSPSAKAAAAQRQAQEQYRAAGGMDPAEKAKIGQDAYTLSIRQSEVALSEIARQRALSADQNVAIAKLEIELVGKSIGQQAEMRANLQARQQLEQEASQNRTKFDEAQYQRLKKINEEIGKQTQMAAIAAANDNIRFGSQTSLLSPEDVQIAAQLRSIYPDVATALDSVQASGLRTNQALSGLSSTISGTLATGLTDVAMGTKSVSQGFSDMAMSVARSIQEMIIKLYVVIPLMRALQSTVSSLGFGFGGDSAAGAMSTGAAGVGGLGGLYHSGGIVGHEPTAMRAVNDNVFFGAPRFHKGLMPDEFPAILQRGEGVFTRGQMAAMGGARSPQVTVNLIEDSSRAGQTDQRQNDNGGLDLTVFVDAITAKNAANPGSATSQAIDNRKRVARR